MKDLIKVIINELRDHKTILDVGVGTGRFAKPLQEHGFRVVGVDIASRMLKRAREKSVRNLVRGGVCSLPLKGKVFDAAVCIHLLHLVSEWKMALREICRVTRKLMLSTTYTTRNPVRQSYSRLLKDCGYKTRRVGKGEWELAEVVRPSKSVLATAFSNKADELLNYLEQRAYSSQWEIPDDVNRGIVNELRGKYGGRAFPAEMRVLVWDIYDLESTVEFQ
jgi:ubiquinone/menaquinone biosynthesis C-methylase UbiE